METTQPNEQQALESTDSLSLTLESILANAPKEGNYNNPFEQMSYIMSCTDAFPWHVVYSYLKEKQCS